MGNRGTRQVSPVHRWRETVRHSRLRPLYKLVLIELSDFMDWETLGSAHPGPALLAHRTGVSIETAKRALKAGVGAELLHRTYTGGSRGGTRTASAYRGNFPTSYPCLTDTGMSRGNVNLDTGTRVS